MCSFTRRLALCAALLAAFASPTAAQDTKALLQLAEQSVFRIEVTEGGAEEGSAILWELGPLDSNGAEATFLTAYHVLHNATKFTIFSHKNEPLATANAQTECFVDRSRELAIVRLRATRPSGGWRAAVRPGNGALANAKINGVGLAFGYPAEEPALGLHYSRGEFFNLATAESLKLVRRNMSLSPGERDPGWMNFQLLGPQETLRGMSGGQVVDAQGIFAGVIYGRSASGFCVMIPAEEALALWGQAAKNKDQWKKLAESPFQHAILFRGGYREDEVTESRLDWSTLDGLTALLGYDPALAIGQFQEIEVVPPERHADAEDLFLSVSASTIPDESHGLQFWLNGKRLEWTRGLPIKIYLKDSPGESLLVAAKTCGRVNDFELSGLVVPSSLDLTFAQGQRQFLRVVRSLPRIVHRYPLFITIKNAADRQVPAAQSPPNVRLAVRLDFIAALLNQAPFIFDVSENPSPRTKVTGAFALDTKEGWALERYSSQQIGVRVKGTTTLDGQKAKYEDVTISLQPAPGTMGPASFSLQGRLQFPFIKSQPQGAERLEPLSGIYVSARATATRGTGSFRADLGNGMNIEMSGILRYLFTAYVNNQLKPVDSAEPNLVDSARLRSLLAAIGLVAPPNWRLDIRQPRVIRKADHDWLILALRMDPEQPPAKPAERPLDLTEPPDDRDVVIDFAAQDVPASLVARFPSLNKDTRYELIRSANTLRAIGLTLWLPDDPAKWFDGLPPSEPLPLADGGNAVANRVFKAFQQATLNGTKTRPIVSRFEADF
jgi:hypothetical protein